MESAIVRPRLTAHTRSGERPVPVHYAGAVLATRPSLRRALVVPVLLSLGLLLVACEKPDASDTTSPSAIALLGTSRGSVTIAPADRPAPTAVTPPQGWAFELGNARFAELENGTPSLIVVLNLKAQGGTAMELWLSANSTPVVRWVGGESGSYDGTVCFQLRLRDSKTGQALALPPADYALTVAFRDHAGQVVTARQATVTSFPPKQQGPPPSADTTVFRDLLSCPRGS